MAEMLAKTVAKPHYPHIALARGLSIVLVAFGHSALADMHAAADVLGVVRMPFFFLLAGLFFSSRHNVLHYSKQKSIALLTPYFFVLTAIGVKQWMSGSDFTTYIAGVLYGNGQTIAWTPLWFLPHLFLLYTSASLLLRPDGFIALKRALQFSIILGWLMLAGVLLAYLQPQFAQSASWMLRSGLPWGIDFLPLSLGYFTLGYLLKQQFTEARFNAALLIVLTALFAALVLMLNAAVDFNLRLYTPALWLPFIIITGCFMLLQCSLLLSKVPLLSNGLMLCGRYSLYILIFHVFLQQILQRLTSSGDLLTQLAILLCSIVLSIATGWFIRRIVLLRYCFEPGAGRVKAVR